MGALFLTAALSLGPAKSPIKNDEMVIFFPTCARLDKERRQWVAPVHGWILEMEENSVKRRKLLGLFRRAINLQEEEEKPGVFEQRARWFLADNEHGKKISIQIQGKIFPAGESDSHGHFRSTLNLPADEVIQLVRWQNRDPWLTYQAATRPKEMRQFPGRILLMEETGLSVISDIDDTVKVTQVGHPVTVLANTFLRDFRAVPGMAEFYGRLAAGGATFHYVSASPWQLFGPLNNFLQENHFPAGTFHLRSFRWRENHDYQAANVEEHKRRTIEEFLENFPRRQFILIGDSGERDPEIYAALARKYPRQIYRVLIRDTTREEPDSKRYRKTFQDFPKGKWQIFRDPKEVQLNTSHLGN